MCTFRRHVRSRSLAVLIVTAFLFAHAPDAAAQTCTPTVPVPPSPVPPGFDYGALATDWCAQLIDCGLDATGCEGVYLDSIATGPQPPVEPPADGGLLGSVIEEQVDLDCSRSLEAENDPTVCVPEPAGAWIFGAGFGLLSALRRTRSRGSRRPDDRSIRIRRER